MRSAIRITCFISMIVAGLLAVSSPAIAAQIVSVTPSADTVAQYEMLEINIELDTTYDNPYDANEVTVDVVLTAPDAEQVQFPAFWFEPYDYTEQDGAEVFTPTGPGFWKARCAPPAQGDYSFHVVVHDASGDTSSDEIDFAATAPTSHGFVRVSERNARYFAFDDGAGYVPLGFNVDWAGETSGGFAYMDYVDDLAAGGGNWTRLWLTHFAQGLILEWGAYHPTGYYQGLGRYSQQAATRLDTILAHAQQIGVYIQIVLHQHSQFETPQWSSWADNPYNAANGGPCATSADYFTNDQALAYERNLHRYLVARYAAYRSLLAWEMWNEADLITDVRMDLMVPWTQDMAAQVRGLDPEHHLVTTSYGLPAALPTYDLTTWDYNNRHQYVYGSWMIGLFLGPYRAAGAPLLLSEFGIDAAGAQNARDTLGVNIHNGIWSALMRGYAGGAMYWWWDDYVGPLDLWPLNLPPGAFLADEDLTRFTDDARASAASGRKRLEACGIAAKNGDAVSEVWAWVHDPASDWWGSMDALPPIDGAVLTLAGLHDAANTTWTGEVWDTWQGQAVAAVNATSDGDTVALALPSFARDVALKLHAEPPAPDDDTVDDDTVDDDTVDDDAVDDDVDDDQADDDADDDVDDDLDDDMDDDVDDDAADDDAVDDDLAPGHAGDDDNSGCGCG